MSRIRKLLVHCAYIAALIDVGACSSQDGLGSSSEVQASGAGQSLFFKQHHPKKKQKKKHHWDDCGDDAGTTDDAGTPLCQSLALHVDSIKHREDTQKATGTINVQVPESLSSYVWGKRLTAQLTFQQGDKRVVCMYAARHHKFGGVSSSLELDSCDNDAKAGDSVAIDSATLSLDCSRFIPFSKVWVELREIEPCGETPMTPPECDPAEVDDNNPCTRDSCGDNGVEHDPLAPGTSCADDDVCNGQETCTANGACGSGTPLACGDADVCNGEEQCDPQAGCVSGDAPNADDGDRCTSDACDPVQGVTHMPVQTDDNNKCTTDACDPAAGVTHVAVPENDDNPCTADACDPTDGVTHTPTMEGALCGSSAFCLSGKCVMLN